MTPPSCGLGLGYTENGRVQWRIFLFCVPHFPLESVGQAYPIQYPEIREVLAARGFCPDCGLELDLNTYLCPDQKVCKFQGLHLVESLNQALGGIQ